LRWISLAVKNADIIDFLEALPEVNKWPELVAVFARAGDVKRPDWDLPILACQAVGGNRSQSLPGAVAVACLQLSIIIVDDILDDDSRGAHLEYGVGTAANMALAYQSLAALILTQAEISEVEKTRASTSLNKATLQTAIGQQLDVQNLRGEDSYWMVVRAKSTPFYGLALELGAILGSASVHVSGGMHSLGVIIGEIIQIEDDLNDALEVPANADWKMGRNNLLLLYAQTAEYAERERFVNLCAGTDDPGALAEAQRILITCGAVSYAAYHLVSRYRKAKQLLARLSLKDPSHLHHILDEYSDSLLSLLNQSDVEISTESLMDL